MSNPEDKHHESAEVSPSSSAETAKELMDIVEDRQQRDAAWEQYKGYDEAYERDNDERVAKKAIAVEHYPQATLIASIRLDADGQVLSGHDHNPEAQSHHDTEAEFQHYLTEIPAEQRFVIYEGSDGEVPDRDTAIHKRADAGLTMYMADQAGIERVGGDPSDGAVATELEKRGISRDETALYTTLRGLGPRLLRDPDAAEDLSKDVHFQLARNGVTGFREYTEAEKIAISATPELRDQVLAQMDKQATQFALEKFNPRLQELGLPQFEIDENGKLTLPGVDGTDLINRTGPMAQGGFREIGRIVTEYRDRHIFDTIADAVQDKKKPFVVYGGSHVVALRPALDRYFGAAA